EKLGKSPGSIEVLNFGERGRGRYISEIIVDRGDPVVFYDVWPRSQLEEWLRGGEWKKYRYFSQMFRHFEFLWDDTGNIIELFRKTRKDGEKLYVASGNRDYQNLSVFLGTAVATIVTKKCFSLQESLHDIPVW
ncbi:MAG: hypothetical protein ACETV1_08060, partial [Candidatus Bathyarchaeia archaeon]